MSSFDTSSLSSGAELHPADYANLRDLDRAGWAWEWLRRNPEFAATKAEDRPRITAPCALVVETDEAWERRLVRWGLHYG